MEKQERTSIKLPPELKEKLLKQAEIENRSLHNMILTILRNFFDR